MKSSDRINYLDALRSVLMILGIVLHSANIFTGDEWAVKNSESSIILATLVDFIHEFRMPAFFIVSGFFCHLTLSRYKSSKFLNQRLPRIAIPLLMTTLTLNIIQNIFLTQTNTGLAHYTEVSYWLSGNWASHLWFLVCLFYYFTFAAGTHHLLSTEINKFGGLITNLKIKYYSLAILLLPTISILAIKLGHYIGYHEEIYIKLFLGEAVVYSPFFIIGFILSYHPPLLTILTQPSKSLLLFTLSMILAWVYIENSYLNIYLESLWPWITSIGCFYIFSNLLDNKSRIFFLL